MPREVRVTPDDDRWHDKSFRFSRAFECEHCGADGHAAEADARCEECGRTTYLPITITVSDDKEQAW